MTVHSACKGEAEREGALRYEIGSYSAAPGGWEQEKAPEKGVDRAQGCRTVPLDHRMHDALNLG